MVKSIFLIQLFFICSLLLALNLNAQVLECGKHYTIALCSSATIESWGENAEGQLGNGNTQTPQLTPVPGIINDVAQIACGLEHVVALKNDGTVWCWGKNWSGQLGNGTFTSDTTPQIVTSLTNIIAVAAHGYHSYALKSNGTVYAWGRNIYGQLGDGFSTNKTTPVKVKNLSNVTEIASGYGHGLALKSNGTVWGWGWNANGQLGDTTIINRYTPVQVMTGCSGVAAGYAHSFFIKDDSTVRASGNNVYGQLGTGNTQSSNKPVNVTNLSEVTEIASYYRHNVALMGNGKMKSWGWNVYGQLALGHKFFQISPTLVPNMDSVIDCAVSYNHTVALKSNGLIYAWGNNDNGQLGDSSTVSSVSAVISQVNCQVGYPWANAGIDVGICLGDSVQLGSFPAAAGGIPPYTYSWTPSIGLNDSSVSNPIASPSSTITYYQTITDNLGSVAFDTIVITVNLTFTAYAGIDVEICNGESIILGGPNVVNCGTMPYTYSWDNGIYLNNSTFAHPVATPSVTTTFTLTVTDSNNNSTSDQVTIVVSTLTSLAGQNVSFCEGDSVNLGASPAASGGAPPYSYEWKPAVGLNDPNIPNPLAKPSNSQTYTLTVTDEDGCSMNDDMDLTVNKLPVVTFSGLASQYCHEDSMVTLVGTPAAGTFIGSSISNNQFDPMIAADSFHNIVYTYTDVNGCTDADTQIVFVFPTILNLSISGLNPSYCINDSPVVLIGSPSSAIFSGPGMTNNIFDPALADSGLHTITLSMVDSNGCQNTTTVNVVVYPLPLVSIDDSDSIYCFTDSPVILNGSPPSAIFSGPGMTNNIFNPSVAGVGMHTITLTTIDTFGCENTDTAMIDVLNVSPAVITGAGNVLTASDGVNFDWYFNGNLTTVHTQSITVATTGNYFVDVTDSNGCLSTSDVYHYSAVGVNPMGYIKSLQVFPNPFDDAISVKWSAYNSTYISIEVLTILGETLLKTDISKSNGQFAKILSLNELQSGTYLLRIKSDQYVEVQKIVKFHQ